MWKPRYYYNQSAVVPFIKTDNGYDVIIITSGSKKHWLIPKGVIEPHLTPIESASMEALEEAGISGTIHDEPTWRYTYGKWGGTCKVTVFIMVVARLDDTWKEDHVRERRRVSVSEALQLVDNPSLRRIIREAHDKVCGYPSTGSGNTGNIP